MAAHVARFQAAGPSLTPNDAVDALCREHVGWIEMIKTIRHVYQVSLVEAETLALAHEGWRRWCDRQLFTDPKCRTSALQEMRRNGPRSRFERDGERIRLRQSGFP
jgi:hypothetical protein